MADWLGTWEKRRKVTVSNTNIDSDLTHFPLLLTLGTSVGTGSTDVSSIFDELTSDANRLKIALTKTDGTTELYGEIEKWDDANETATIWVSKSDLVLANDGTTDIYMYYDSTADDNTTYIGDTNDVVAENVWDSNYVMVQHMADGASTSATYDSTGNDNDGTKLSANNPLKSTSGAIGDCQAFSSDYIRVSRSVSVDWTVSAWIKTTAVIPTGTEAYSGAGIVYGDLSGYHADSLPLIFMNSKVSFGTGDTEGQSNFDTIQSTSTVNSGNWTKVTCTRVKSSGTKHIWVNDIDEANADASTATLDAASYFYIGKNTEDTIFFDGSIDEIRISDIARSDAWIKADYYTQSDDIVAWGSEEELTPTPTGNAISFAANF